MLAFITPIPFCISSQEMPRSSFNVELDSANATWLLSDVALLSTKTGELLLLTLVYDGRYANFSFYLPHSHSLCCESYVHFS